MKQLIIYKKHGITLLIKKRGFIEENNKEEQCKVAIIAIINRESREKTRDLIVLKERVKQNWGGGCTNREAGQACRNLSFFGRTFAEAYQEALTYCKEQISHIEAVFAEIEAERIIAEIDDPFVSGGDLTKKIKNFIKDKKHYLYLQRKIEKWEKEEK